MGLPSLPSTFSLFNGIGNAATNTVSQAVTSATNSLGLTSGATAPTLGKNSVDWTGLFLRAVVIILGFIFVAVGLTMFHSSAPIIVNQANNAVRGVSRKVALRK
jgi:beta-lactamase regulating signal transducer with metallopeptidase domain